MLPLSKNWIQRMTKLVLDKMNIFINALSEFMIKRKDKHLSPPKGDFLLPPAFPS